MSLATCDSLLAIKIKYKTLFKIILDTSDRLPQNRKPFSVDSEILSMVRTDATVARKADILFLSPRGDFGMEL